MTRRKKPKLNIKRPPLGVHLIMPKSQRKEGIKGGKRLHELVVRNSLQ